MKKYIIVVTSIIFAFLLYNVLRYNLGLFIPPSSDQINTTFVTKNKKIIYNDKEYIVKGVNVSSVEPGLYNTDFNVKEDTYYRWLTQIKEMGANTIRVHTILNDDFYNAFYKYNTEHKDSPLYLLQGVLIKTYPLNNRNDAYNKEYLGELIKNSKIAVDVVHGKRKILDNTSAYSSGNFRKDVSKWVMGYIINVEMNTNTVVYTDNKKEIDGRYNGNYIKTSEDASNYEGMLARVMDALVSYETKKYREQRLVSFENSPLFDPFDYSDEVTYHYKKATKVDMNHLIETDKLKSGMFVSYEAYSYYYDYLGMQNKIDKMNAKPIKKKKNSKKKHKKPVVHDYYLEYLTKLSDYYIYPTMVTSFGYSTTRGRNGVANNLYPEASGLTEEEQGLGIVKSYETILKANMSGGFIDEWTDDSNKESYNTIKRVDTSKLPWWFDVQSSASGKGILKFESGEDETIVTLDGDISEWRGQDRVLTNKDLSLYSKYDFKYVYFAIELTDTESTAPVTILVDTTNKSGSKYVKRYNINANRGVDFAIRIDGLESRLVVQERYNTFKPIDYYDAYDRNPYDSAPEKDSDEFKDVYLLERSFYKDLAGNFYEPSLFETGKLKFGSTLKNNKDYNTQADYYKKGNIIELRIPWQLFNFSDPSNLEIHDDYYTKFGVENISLLNVYLDATRDNTANLKKFKLHNVDNRIYHEELKDSYNIIKESWR